MCAVRNCLSNGRDLGPAHSISATRPRVAASQPTVRLMTQPEPEPSSYRTGTRTVQAREARTELWLVEVARSASAAAAHLQNADAAVHRRGCESLALLSSPPKSPRIRLARASNVLVQCDFGAPVLGAPRVSVARWMPSAASRRKTRPDTTARSPGRSAETASLARTTCVWMLRSVPVI